MKCLPHLAIVFTLCIGGTARASVILWENLPDTSAAGTGWNSNLGFGQQIADSFVLSEDALLTEITFWGYLNAPEQLTTFEIRIFGDDSGLPAIDPLVAWTAGAIGVDTGLVASQNGATIFEWTVHTPVPAMPLPAGMFWLSVLGPGFVNDPIFVWFHGQLDTGHPLVVRGDDGLAWDADFEQPADGTPAPAFRLRGVPEPAALALLSVGVAGIALRRRRPGV